MPNYCVRSYDVLFFRGNKSFSFGEWYTEGVFPPYPSTFQGFIRSKILFDKNLIDASGNLNNPTEAENAVGNDTNLKLEITGPYLMDEKTKEVYFKTPADIFKKDSNVNCCYSALQKIGAEMETDMDFPLSSTEHPKEKLDNLYPPKFISLEELKQYRTSLDNIGVEDKELFLSEDRVAIGFDKTKKNNRSVQDKRFCVTQYKRLRDDMRFYCSVDFDAEIMKGALKFGSEAHPVYIQKMQEMGDASLIENGLKDSRATLINTICETKTFRMVLLQHGVFKNGWFPFDYIDANTKEPCAKVDGLDLKFLFAFTGNPIKVSGYSFATSNPGKQNEVKLKPVVNAVPSGSVYLFKITNGCTKKAIENFVNRYDNQKIEYKQYSQMGFNHVILGIGTKEVL